MGIPVGLPHVYTGKVRELYEVGHDRLLMVASDRVSVFDVELPDEIIALIAGGKQDFAAFGLEIPGFFFDQFKDFNPTSFLTALSEVVATLPAFKNPM